MKIGAWEKAVSVWRSPAGFTIVETMIVLAVTGGLFVAVAATLIGRQNSAEFQHAVQNVQAHIQQTINQVSDGFYPNNSDFSCSSSGGKVQINLPNGSQQGENDQCVFLGKVIQFDVQGTNPEQYQVYNIAGVRCDPTTKVGCVDPTIPSPFKPANPTVIGFINKYPQYATSFALEYGLSTVWVRSDNKPTCTSIACSFGAVGFLMEPGTLDNTSFNGYAGGKQQIDLIPIHSPGVILGQIANAAVAAIQSAASGGLNDSQLTSNAPINPNSGVQICLRSGGTNQSGLLTVGGSGRQLLVTLSIKPNNNCT